MPMERFSRGKALGHGAGRGARRGGAPPAEGGKGPAHKGLEEAKGKGEKERGGELRSPKKEGGKNFREKE